MMGDTASGRRSAQKIVIKRRPDYSSSPYPPSMCSQSKWLLILAVIGLPICGHWYLYRHQGQQTSGIMVPGQLATERGSTLEVHVDTTGTTSAPETTTKAVVCPELNLTFVSAFFDFGNHPKGRGSRNVEEYYPWSNPFGRIYTPLIFYTDSAKFAEHVRKLRAHMAERLTTVIQLNNTIAALYARKDYPKHAPNTVVPAYSCSMHAKYACLHDAIVSRAGLVTTRLVAWIDIGYYRDLQDTNISYCVTSPKNFDPTKVLFNQVFTPNFNLTARDIFYGNHVWVGGGMFIATRDVMVKFCDEYKRAATFFLFKRDLSSTDQQTLYASMTNEGRKDVNLTVDIAVIPGTHSWFDLGKSLLTPAQ